MLGVQHDAVGNRLYVTSMVSGEDTIGGQMALEISLRKAKMIKMSLLKISKKQYWKHFECEQYI